MLSLRDWSVVVLITRFGLGAALVGDFRCGFGKTIHRG